MCFGQKKVLSVCAYVRLPIVCTFVNAFSCNQVGQKGGCIIVDSTRKGKRFPDSMSKTIPIWTCVLNRAIQRYRSMVHENGSIECKVSERFSLHFPISTLTYG